MADVLTGGGEIVPAEPAKTERLVPVGAENREMAEELYTGLLASKEPEAREDASTNLVLAQLYAPEGTANLPVDQSQIAEGVRAFIAEVDRKYDATLGELEENDRALGEDHQGRVKRDAIYAAREEAHRPLLTEGLRLIDKAERALLDEMQIAPSPDSFKNLSKAEFVLKNASPSHAIEYARTLADSDPWTWEAIRALLERYADVKPPLHWRGYEPHVRALLDETPEVHTLARRKEVVEWAAASRRRLLDATGRFFLAGRSTDAASHRAIRDAMNLAVKGADDG